MILAKLQSVECPLPRDGIRSEQRDRLAKHTQQGFESVGFEGGRPAR